MPQHFLGTFYIYLLGKFILCLFIFMVKLLQQLTRADHWSEKMQIQIKHRFTDAALFECAAPDGLESGLHLRHALEQAVAAKTNLGGADLRGADLGGADLGGANLRDADLGFFKADLFDILLRAPKEVAAVRAALVAGRVNGSVYEGACACLVGTIAIARGVSHRTLGNGIEPNSSRPAEQWFMQINTGDTPDSSSVVKMTVEWIDEFAALLANAAAVAEA